MKLTTTSDFVLVSFSADEAAKLIAATLGLPSFAKVTISRSRKAKKSAPAPIPSVPKIRDVKGEELAKLIIAVDTRIHNSEFDSASAIIHNATGYTQHDCDYIATNWRTVRLAWNVLQQSIRPNLVPVS